MRRNVWLVISLMMILPVLLSTAACTKKMVQTEPVSANEPEVQKAPDTTADAAEQAGQLNEDRPEAEATGREAAGKALVSEKIHFAFDSSLLSEQDQQMLNSKADYLRANPDITITIEGHCDDRGMDDYNIALGERRAESVKIYLVNLGIATSRLKTVSYGEKRPIAMGRNEVSWAKNRRAQFVIN
jgi:peptidoglycan-associated lipoprotein